MQKYIAFNLYQRNDLGGCQPTAPLTEARDVYLASEVDARLSELEKVLRKIAEGGMFSETACIGAARKVLGYPDGL